MLTVAVWLSPYASAAEGNREAMNRVSFQVERSTEVANDSIRAIVGITDEDTDSARLADRVNKKMTRALAAAKAVREVHVESAGYSTYPVHQDGKLRRWRASQDMVLESRDVEAVTKLVGKLQGELQLRSIEFFVSPERRREIEDKLIAEVLAAFKQRAEIVRTNLSATDYEIVRIGINSQGAPPRPVRFAMEARSMAASKVAAPALEGGNSRVGVQINATIELQ